MNLQDFTSRKSIRNYSWQTLTICPKLINVKVSPGRLSKTNLASFQKTWADFDKKGIDGSLPPLCIVAVFQKNYWQKTNLIRNMACPNDQ